MSNNNSDDIESEVTIDDMKRDSQNTIIAIMIIYIVTILLYFSARQDNPTVFDRIIVIVLIANSIYLIIELFKYRRLAAYKEEIIK